MSVADRVERPKTIVLKAMGFHEEGEATEGLSPGHLLKLSSTVGLPKVPAKCAKQTVDGGPSLVRVAKEDALRGKTINDAYVTGDIVPYITAVPGDVLYVRAAADTYTAGERLASAGDGTFTDAGSDTPLVEAEENLILSAPGFLRVRVL